MAVVLITLLGLDGKETLGTTRLELPKPTSAKEFAERLVERYK